MSRAYRYRTTGQGTPWIVAPDRGRTKNDGARFVRPADQPPLWLGVLILVAVLGIIVAAVCFVSVLRAPPAASPDAHALASSGSPPSHASSVSAHGQPGAGQ